MAGYKLYLTRGGGPPDPSSSNTAVINPDQIIDPDLPQSHSDIDEWQIVVPLTRSLNDWRLAEIFIEYEARDGTTELIYRGRLDTVNHNESTGLTTLRGESVDYKLTTGSSQQRYQGEVVADAIRDYWAEETPFSASVEDPNPQTVDEGKTIQSASTTPEFQDLFGASISDTDPVTISNGSLGLAQTGFVFESEDYDSEFETYELTSSDYSGGVSRGLNGAFSELTFDFTVDYTIPAEHVGFAFRYDARGEFSNHYPFITQVNEEDVTFSSNPGALLSELGWFDGVGIQNDLEPGTNHTARFKLNEDAYGSDMDDMVVDLIFVFDDRFEYNYLSSNSVHEPDGYLDGPNLYPLSQVLDGETYEEEWNTTGVDVSLGIDNTSGEQSIEVSNDGGDTYAVSGPNTADVSADFDTIGSLIKSRLTISRKTDLTAQSATPRYGYEGQTISSFQLDVDTDDLAIFNDREFAGSDFEILSELHDEAGYSWVIDPAEDDTNLEAHSFPRGSIEKTADWTTVEGIKDGYEMRDYANIITVFGAYDEANSEYLVAEARNEDEIQRLLDLGFTQEEAEIEDTLIKPDLDNSDDLRQVARSELVSRVAEDQMDATVPIVPKVITPGYSYPVPELEDAEGNVPVLPLEEVSFQDGNDPRGDLRFEDPTDIANVVRDVSTDVRRTKRAIR